MKKKLIDVVWGIVGVAIFASILWSWYAVQPKETQTETANLTQQTAILPTVLKPQETVTVEEVVTEEVMAAPEIILDVPMDAVTQHFIYDLCNELNVDFYIVMAMIETESGFNPNAVNDSGTCIGYMQVNPQYHSMGMDITYPMANLTAGINLMHRLLEHSGYDYTWALNAYNGGGGYADSIGADTDYSIKIKERAREYAGI